MARRRGGGGGQLWWWSFFLSSHGEFGFCFVFVLSDIPTFFSTVLTTRFIFLAGPLSKGNILETSFSPPMPQFVPLIPAGPALFEPRDSHPRSFFLPPGLPVQLPPFLINDFLYFSRGRGGEKDQYRIHTPGPSFPPKKKDRFPFLSIISMSFLLQKDLQVLLKCGNTRPG